MKKRKKNYQKFCFFNSKLLVHPPPLPQKHHYVEKNKSILVQHSIRYKYYQCFYNKRLFIGSLNKICKQMNLINTTDLSILILPTNRSGGQNRHLKILICYKKNLKIMFTSLLIVIIII